MTFQFYIFSSKDFFASDMNGGGIYMHFITKAAEDIGKTAQVCSSSDDTSI